MSEGDKDGKDLGSELWRHPDPESTQMWAFLNVDDIAGFWAAAWQHTGITASVPYEEVLPKDASMFPRPPFFQGAKLNFAENLLFPPQAPDSNSPAIIAATETGRETVTWAELREKVRQCQSGMLNAKVKAGDRVAGYVANHTNALVAMLAATSLGAIWTAISPDTGITAVLDRLVQIEPVLLFCDNAVLYNGKTHPTIPKVLEIGSALPTLQAIVIFSTVSSMSSEIDAGSLAEIFLKYDEFVKTDASPEKTIFTPLPPDHPVYILYSSGTTGAPKCIVHGAIGTLIQHKKEHMLHCDIRPGDRLFYFTTCTWMMWHWLVSGLASGATLVLYDGSPFRYLSNGDSIPDDLAMAHLIDELKITHFGTSAKYLSVLEQKSIMPKSQNLSLKTLKAIYSTGSPLAPSTFQYVYKAFGSINLGSITGGTDIISLFGAPCQLTPVYTGEIQVLGLGMAVRAWDYQGKDVTTTGEAGDLVCTKPFPCQPVQFWGPTGASKYQTSYFETFGPEVWHHGDFIRFNPSTGGLYMLGRSDGILKPSGVRFGSAEIYNILLKHFPAEVEDALCIGRRRETDSDETVVLFLKMKEGEAFSRDLMKKVQGVVRKELSARHVPGIVDETPEIPVTTNGKKVEAAVKQILCGMNVKTSTSVANAACLDWYREWSSSHA